MSVIIPLYFYWKQNFNYTFLILLDLLAISSFIISFVFIFLYFLTLIESGLYLQRICKSHKGANHSIKKTLLTPQKLKLLLQLSLHLYLSATVDLKLYVHTKTYIQTFLAALLIIAPNWKWSRCFHGLMDRETMHIYPGEYYSVMKEKSWMNFKCTLLYSTKSKP